MLVVAEFRNKHCVNTQLMMSVIVHTGWSNKARLFQSRQHWWHA